jgi:hypothetical protein
MTWVDHVGIGVIWAGRDISFPSSEPIASTSSPGSIGDLSPSWHWSLDEPGDGANANPTGPSGATIEVSAYAGNDPINNCGSGWVDGEGSCGNGTRALTGALHGIEGNRGPPPENIAASNGGRAVLLGTVSRIALGAVAGIVIPNPSIGSGTPFVGSVTVNDTPPGYSGFPLSNGMVNVGRITGSR